MGLVSKLETKLEGLIEWPFAARGQIDFTAIEIALGRLMEKEKTNVLGVFMVPSCYVASFESLIFNDLEPFFDRIKLRLETSIRETMREKGYRAEPDLSVEFKPGTQAERLFSVSCEWKNRNVTPQNQIAVRQNVKCHHLSKNDNRQTHESSHSVPTLLNKNSGESYPITTTPVIVGRGAGSNVVIPDVSVSEAHARITRVYDKLILEDLGSTNGTRVNRRYVKKALLQDGDEIMMGNSTLIVCA